MGQPVPGLTVSFIKKDGFKPTFKHRELVFATDLNWELVLKYMGLVAEGSASQSTLRDRRNYQ